MNKKRLMELAGVQLNEGEKSVEAVLKYFEETGRDASSIYYKIKGGYSAEMNNSYDVVGVAVSKNGEKFQSFDTEQGRHTPTKQMFVNMKIFKHQQVY